MMRRWKSWRNGSFDWLLLMMRIEQLDVPHILSIVRNGKMQLGRLGAWYMCICKSSQLWPIHCKGDNLKQRPRKSTQSETFYFCWVMCVEFNSRIYLPIPIVRVHFVHELCMHAAYQPRQYPLWALTAVTSFSICWMSESLTNADDGNSVRYTFLSTERKWATRNTYADTQSHTFSVHLHHLR